jgi:flagellar protein FlaG
MNIVQNVNDLGGAGLSPEHQRTSETITHNNTIDERTDKITAEEKQFNTVQKSTEESVTEQPLTATQLDKVAQQLQDLVGDLNRNIEFSVDEDSGRDVIKVIDKDSGDLLKQYPSEEVLTLVSKLSDMVGGLVDTKV